MHIFGIGLIAVGVVGLIILAADIVWQEIRSLRYLRRLDEWASELDEWASELDEWH